MKKGSITVKHKIIYTVNQSIQCVNIFYAGFLAAALKQQPVAQLFKRTLLDSL
jgi:hypothetical protein